MTGDLGLLLWVFLVIAGIASMQWGSAHASQALDDHRERVGLRGVVAGALLGMATAAPEICVNIASVTFGWPDLGLGAALGSNVPALPLVFLIAWLSLRTAAARPETTSMSAAGPTTAPVVATAAVAVQAVPYLLIVLLLAALTLPPAWAGLQPIDGALLVAAWAGYLARALLRPHHPAEHDPEPQPDQAAAPAPVSAHPIGRAALLALPALALGALASVIAAQRLGQAFGASDLVVGIFVIGLLCALPESFAAWRLARAGKTTTAVSAVMADGIVSLSVGLVAPALAGAALGNVALYLANLAYLGFALLSYVALNHFRRGQELGLARVSIFVGGYVAYLGAVVVLLAR